jgi:Zn-dependent protease/CBS domain-containing protein
MSVATLMRGWSIPLGRVFGIEIRIHMTFFFLLFFVWVTEQSAPHTANTALRGIAIVAIVLACVALHELAHLLLSKTGDVLPKTIVLLPIGGVSLVDETLQQVPTPDAWKREIQIALAGPLINLALAAAAAGVIQGWMPQVHLFERPYIYFHNLPRAFFWCNVGLAALNLLPGYPLDGGRVLRALFSRSTDPARATRRALSIGQTLAIVFMVSGMIQYFQGGGTETAWLTLIGFFIFIGAQLEERSAVFQAVLETVHLEDVMLTDFATLSPADTLEDALDKAVHTLQDDFPVVRGGDMVGVISKQKILEALRADGNGYVQAVMNKLFEAAQKKESLASAFRKLTTRNLSLIPVVEDQRLVGIVTLQNLMHSMALLAESRKLRRESLT